LKRHYKERDDKNMKRKALIGAAVAVSISRFAKPSLPSVKFPKTVPYVYGVYCKRNDIISAFDKLIEKAL